MIILMNIKKKMVICLALTGTTVHNSVINKFLVTAPALPYSKCVFKSQNRKCVCKSQKVCLYFCVCHKIENVCVSHKILIHQVLPRGSDRGEWQWSAMVFISVWRITC